MTTPFHQQDNGANNWGADPNQQWNQGPAAQPPAPAPSNPQQWGGMPNQSYGQAYSQSYGQSYIQQKSMIIAALLAFFLGTLGVHNFYLGYTRAGVAQLALTVTGWLFSFILIGLPLLFVVGVWAFIEFVLILLRSGRFSVDFRGVPLL
ncbi:MAG: TM2 domain-containing protein [Corynebacterium sp.]|nr:TM2 domain-containing protein [Corynebacterium sp.]